MTTHPHRRNQLIRIATDGKCQDESELPKLKAKNQIKVLTTLAKWNDDNDVLIILEIIKSTVVE